MTTVSDSALIQLPIAFEIAEDASCDDCLNLAAKWLHECATLHPACIDTSSFTPTRLIYAGNDGRCPFLYITSPGEKIKYAALSHCWGGKVPLTTTCSSLDQRKRGIPFATFPKTFQDTLILARRLSLDYVWIDSLCIIQDDESDWAKESARMGPLYHNAHITIAADVGSCSTSGFLVKRPKETQPKAFDLRLEERKATIYARRRMIKQGGDRAIAHTPIKFKARNPLFNRAWAFQERLLSSKILHFTDTEICWECNSWTRCECRPDAIPLEPDRGYFRIMKEWAPGFHIGRPDYGSAFLNSFAGLNHHREWMQLVQLYTMRDLTFQTDRLPAMAGLAAWMGKLTGMEYIAGIWKEGLKLQLMWYVPENIENIFGRSFYPEGFSSEKKESSRHINYYAPSWSWASITGPVSFLVLEAWEQQMVGQVLDIVNVQYTTSTANPFGPVKEARLTVTGLVAPVRVYPFTPPNPTNSLMNIKCTRNKTLSGRFFPDIRDKNPEFEDDEPLFALQLVYTHLNFRNGATVAMVMRRSQRDVSCYERIGFMETIGWNIIEWCSVGTTQTITII
jgi:hypothetical protein